MSIRLRLCYNDGMTYVFGLLCSLFAEVIFGTANLLDSHLAKRTFTSSWALVTTNGLFLLVCLPVFFIVLNPETPTVGQISIFILIASLDFFYQIPYYSALKTEETSVVVLLFNLEKLFVPILAYFTINEHLTVWQYVGFAIIVFGSIAISAKGHVVTSIRSLVYMIAATLMLSISAIFQKQGLESMPWQSFYFWIIAFSSPFPLFLYMASSSVRLEVKAFLRKPLAKNHIPLFLQNIATWVGGVFAMVG